MCFFSNDDTCKHKIIEGKAFGDPTLQSMDKKKNFSLKDCTIARMTKNLLPSGNQRRKWQFETLNTPAKITVKQNKEEGSIFWVLESWSKGWSEHIVLIGCFQSFALISQPNQEHSHRK